MNLLKFRYYRLQNIISTYFNLKPSLIFLLTVNRLKFEGYNLIRSDHSSHSRKRGVCVYYKKHIPLVRRDDCNLSNCLFPEIRLKNESAFLPVFTNQPAKLSINLKNFAHILTLLRFI